MKRILKFIGCLALGCVGLTTLADPVAKIGDVAYDDFAQAWADLQKNGGEMTLLADVSNVAADAAFPKKTVIDLNEHTLQFGKPPYNSSSYPCVNTASDLVIKNGEFCGNCGKPYSSYLFHFSAKHNLTLDNVTFKYYRYGIQTSTSGQIVINNSTIRPFDMTTENGPKMYDAGACILLNNNASKVTVTGDSYLKSGTNESQGTIKIDASNPQIEISGGTFVNGTSPWTVAANYLAFGATFDATTGKVLPAPEVVVPEVTVAEVKETVEPKAGSEELTDEEKTAVAQKTVELLSNEEVAKAENTGIRAAAVDKDDATKTDSLVVAALKAAVDSTEITDKTAAKKEVETTTVISFLEIKPIKTEVNKAAGAVACTLLAFDVTPKVKAQVAGQTVIEATIPNEAITEPITVRIPVTDDFTEYAKVTHRGDQDEVFYLPVQGELGNRFVEFTATKFSEYDAEPVLESAVPVAKVGTTEYPTLQAAVDAADGETVVLLRDVTSDGVEFSKNLVIDFNGKQITFPNSTAFFSESDNVTLEFKNGAAAAATVNFKGNFVVFVGNAQKVVFGDNITYVAEPDQLASFCNCQGSNAEAVVNGGTFEWETKQTVFDSFKKVTFNGGSVKTYGYVVRGLYPISTVVDVHAGTFVQLADPQVNSDIKSMFLSVKELTVDETVGTVAITTPKALNTKASPTYPTKCTDTLKGGEYTIGNFTDDTGKAASGTEYHLVIIEGGRYDVGKFGSNSAGYTPYVMVKAGTFKEPINGTGANVEHYEGSVSITNDDGSVSYSVQPVAKIGENEYETFAEAFAAANDDDVVEMLRKCERTSTLTIDKSITLKTKDLVVAATAGAGLALADGAKVTLDITGDDNAFTGAAGFAGINVPVGTELTITGTGKMVANGGAGAEAIGAGQGSTNAQKIIDTDSGALIVLKGDAPTTMKVAEGAQGSIKVPEGGAAAVLVPADESKLPVEVGAGVSEQTVNLAEVEYPVAVASLTRTVGGQPVVTRYASLQEACTAGVSEETAVLITLLADTDAHDLEFGDSSNSTYWRNNDVTIDLGNHKMKINSMWTRFNDNVKFSIVNGTIDVSGATGCTFDEPQNYVFDAYKGNGILEFKNVHFVGEDVKVEWGVFNTYRDTTVPRKASLNIQDCTFDIAGCASRLVNAQGGPVTFVNTKFNLSGFGVAAFSDENAGAVKPDISFKDCEIKISNSTKGFVNLAEGRFDSTKIEFTGGSYAFGYNKKVSFTNCEVKVSSTEYGFKQNNAVVECEDTKFALSNISVYAVGIVTDSASFKNCEFKVVDSKQGFEQVSNAKLDHTTVEFTNLSDRGAQYSYLVLTNESKFVVKGCGVPFYDQKKAEPLRFLSGLEVNAGCEVDVSDCANGDWSSGLVMGSSKGVRFAAGSTVKAGSISILGYTTLKAESGANVVVEGSIGDVTEPSNVKNAAIYIADGKYGSVVSNTPSLKVVLLTGGVYKQEPAKEFIDPWYEAVPNTDAVTKAEGYAWMIAKKVPQIVTEPKEPEVIAAAAKVVDESGNPVSKEGLSNPQKEQINTLAEKVAAVQTSTVSALTFVETEIDKSVMNPPTSPDAKPTVKANIVAELKEKAIEQGLPEDAVNAQIKTDSDVTNYIDVDITTPEMKLVDANISLKALTYDVKPMVKTVVVTQDAAGNEVSNVVERQLANSEIVRPLTFRMPLTTEFVGQNIKVTHSKDPEGTQPVEGSWRTRVYPVKGTGTDVYVEVQSDKFSFFKNELTNDQLTQVEVWTGGVWTAVSTLGDAASIASEATQRGETGVIIRLVANQTEGCILPVNVTLQTNGHAIGTVTPQVSTTGKPFTLTVDENGVYRCIDFGVSEVKVKQRYPWNGLVDISYTLSDSLPSGYDLIVTLTDKWNAQITYSATTFLAPPTFNKGVNTVVWNAVADLNGLVLRDFKCTIWIKKRLN